MKRKHSKKIDSSDRGPSDRAIRAGRAGSETLFGEIDSGTGAETELSKEAEIASLRQRYDSGEQPTDRPDREKGKEKVRKNKKEREDEAARLETFAGSLGLLAQVASQLLCSALPNPKPPSDIEIQILNDCLTAVAQKHFDKFLEYDAELALTIAVLAIVLPRMKHLKKEIPPEVMNMADSAAALKTRPTDRILPIPKEPDATESNT